MKQVVRVKTVVVNGKPVYQIETQKRVWGNRTFSLNAIKQALTPLPVVEAAFKRRRMVAR